MSRSLIEAYQKIQGVEMQIAYDYQSFVLLDSLSIDKENLERKLAEKTFYSITINWDEELPFLAAQYIENNYNHTLWKWIALNNSIVFSPLTFSEKERMIRELNNFSGLNIKQSVVLY
jgi:hypothetical protein